MPTIWPAGMAKGHVGEDFGAVDPVAEGDMLEGDVAAERRQRRASWRKLRLGRRVQDVAKPLDRKPGLMEILPDLREPRAQEC